MAKQDANQHGAVLLKDSVMSPMGAWVLVYVGDVTIHNRADLGVEDARGSESWVAEISGPAGRVFVPGCQVRAVEFGDAWDDAVAQVRHL